MARRCSSCGIIGHNARTCSRSGSDCGLKLFGVRLPTTPPPPPGKKCLGTECLPPAPPPSSSPASSSSSTYSLVSISDSVGKLSSKEFPSDGLPGRNAERKKGVPWSEEEHRAFLVGLEKLGKGDWRGISRSFVTTRTPTQVASHAQKYFLRQSGLGKKKRRSSLFDVIERMGRACHATTDSCKLGDRAPSSDPHVNARARAVEGRAQDDLNSDHRQQERRQPCLQLMLGCGPSLEDTPLEARRPSSALDEPRVVKFSVPDLELKIDQSTVTVT